MVLGLLWFGIGMVLFSFNMFWYYFGVLGPSLLDFSSGLILSYPPPKIVGMVLVFFLFVWFWYGLGMGLVWCWYGFGVVLVWLLYGFGMV